MYSSRVSVCPRGIPPPWGPSVLPGVWLYVRTPLAVAVSVHFPGCPFLGLFVCPWESPPTHRGLHLYIGVSVHPLDVCLSIGVSIYLMWCPCVHWGVLLSFWVSIWASSCPSGCLLACLSVGVSICPSGSLLTWVSSASFLALHPLQPSHGVPLSTGPSVHPPTGPPIHLCPPPQGHVHCTPQKVPPPHSPHPPDCSHLTLPATPQWFPFWPRCHPPGAARLASGAAAASRGS